MKELIRITMNEKGEQLVDGRELHNRLGVKTPYKNWFPRVSEYFIEGEDFSTILCESTGGRPSINHVMTLDMAKHVAMLQRSEIGKEIRQYFIDFEKEHSKKKLTPAEQLFEQAKYMVELERRVEDTEQSVKRLEHNIRRVTTSDYFTVIAYANMNNIKPNTYNTSSVGRKASKMCRERNINIGKVVDSKYGLINTYPSNILDEIFGSMGL